MLEAAPPNCSVVAKSPCTFGHFLVIGERPNSQEVSRFPCICGLRLYAYHLLSLSSYSAVKVLIASRAAEISSCALGVARAWSIASEAASDRRGDISLSLKINLAVADKTRISINIQKHVRADLYSVTVVSVTDRSRHLVMFV